MGNGHSNSRQTQSGDAIGDTDMTTINENTYTYTVCEDQPNADKWDVEIKSFNTLEAARRFLIRAYSDKERGGGCDNCAPFIRNDWSEERV